MEVAPNQQASIHFSMGKGIRTMNYSPFVERDS
jgi:hypothetical protein